MKMLATTSVLWAVTLLFMVHEPVTYTQVFAERVITLTEDMTLFEKNLLPQKKGFIQYG